MGRPLSSWHGFVGQRPIVTSLQEHCHGALAKGVALPDIQFGGQSGVGKTHLARALAAEMQTVCHEFYSSRGIPKHKLVEVLTSVKAADIVFVDEAHSLPVDSQEMLYRAISNHERPEIDPEKNKIIDNRWVAMSPFTLVLATDQPGMLRNALKKRIGLSYTLDLYSDDELRVIVGNYAAELGILMKPQARTRVAQAARGIPRKGRLILRSIHIVMPDTSVEVTKPMVIRHLRDHFGLDSRNLNPTDRLYLQILQDRGGKMSLANLALQLGLDKASLQCDIEPYLVREGLVEIRPGGRLLKPEGKALDVRKEVR
jgi:Holliday junction resolvasome RuvABC ATP-dependent DNA helicase subunit